MKTLHITDTWAVKYISGRMEGLAVAIVGTDSNSQKFPIETCNGITLHSVRMTGKTTLCAVAWTHLSTSAQHYSSFVVRSWLQSRWAFLKRIENAMRGEDSPSAVTFLQLTPS